jgi:hypothetical protein
VAAILAGKGIIRLNTEHGEIVLLLPLLAEAQHFHGMLAVVKPHQFRDQVLDMNACSTIDMRGILIGQKNDFHSIRSRQQALN